MDNNKKKEVQIPRNLDNFISKMTKETVNIGSIYEQVVQLFQTRVTELEKEVAALKLLKDESEKELINSQSMGKLHIADVSKAEEVK